MNDRKPIFVSAAGRAALEQRLADKRQRHRDICAEREVAHELSGDGWHDNPHFNYLQQMEANATREVMELEGLLGRTRVYEVLEGSRPTDRVAIGSVVTVLLVDEDSGEEHERRFEIAGFQESDMATGKVGYNVPLAGRLLGLEVGDIATIELPNGRYEVEVLDLAEDASGLGD